MILIDKNEEIAQKFAELEQNPMSLLKLDLDTYQISNGLQDDLILIHADFLNENSEILNKLERQVSLIVFYEEALPVTHLENVQGSYKIKDIDDNISKQIQSFENLLKERVVTKSTLHSMSLEMNEIIKQVDSQLIRVKKSYEVKTPRRFKKIKGVKLLSKYAAGDSIGGEFLDSFIHENKIFILMSETSSYLASSSILETFSEMKAKGEINDTSAFDLISNIKDQMVIIDQSKIKKELTVKILCAVIDLSCLTIKGYSLGDFEILSNQKIQFYNSNKLNLLNSQIEHGEFEVQIDSFEKVLFVSPGLMKNWVKYCPKQLIEEIIRNSNLNIIEILDEIFFELKRNLTTGYLEHDACSIILEVDKNAIRKV